MREFQIGIVALPGILEIRLELQGVENISKALACIYRPLTNVMDTAAVAKQLL